METFITVCVIFVALAAFVTFVIAVERRRHQRLTAILEARGLKVVKYAYHRDAKRRVVDYISPEGDLRQATVHLKTGELRNERPFVEVLKEQFQDPKTSPDMRHMILALGQSKLPGQNEYHSIAKSLLSNAAAGPAAARIEESSTNATEQRRFVQLLQCFEAGRISSTNEASDVIELYVGHKRLDLQWTVEGVAPNRVLVVRGTVGTGPDLEPAPAN